ncbi:MAG: MlaD family protein [Phycisphaerae bacterium]
MPKKAASEVAVGLFVVIALGLGVGIILWLGVAEVFAPDGQVLTLYAPQDTGPMGLKPGYDVNFGDEKIGKVTRISVDPEKRRTLYTVQLLRTDLKVRADGQAAVDSPPLGMPKLVIYDLGTSDTLADEQNPIRLRPGGLTQAMSDLASITAQLKQIASGVQKELDPNRAEALLAKIHNVVDDLKLASTDVATIAGSIQQQTDVDQANSLLAKIHKSVQDVNYITGNLRREADPNVSETMLAKLHASLDHVNQVTGDVRDVIAETRPKVSKIMDSVVKTTDKIETYVSKDVAEILAKVRQANTKILEIAGDFADVSKETKQIIVLNRDNIDRIIDDMAQVADNLKATSKEIRRNPWRLIHKPDRKEIQTQDIYDAARAFSEGASSLTRAMSKLQNLHEEYPKGIDPDNPELPKIRKELNQSFDRFQKVEQALWKELGKQK